MKLFIPFFCFGLLPVLLPGQTDSLPQPKQLPWTARITAARQELRKAFLADDPAAAGLWMDSLGRLENNSYIGLVWDERWLLYFWEEAYGNMFDEVTSFDIAAEDNKLKPRPDSLFKVLDQTLYEQRFQLYDRIRTGFLNEEEKAFAVLQLDYLLRLNTDKADWVARLDAFLKRYPSSRFAEYIRSIRPESYDAGAKGIGLYVGYANGDWRGALDRSLNPLNAVNVSFYLWRQGWHIEINTISGQPTLAKRVEHHGFDWLKDDGTYFRTTGLEVGRDLLDNKRLRFTPAAGVYFSSLSPKPPDGKDNPDYYAEFYFADLHLGASVAADLKLFHKDWNLQGIEKGSFHGLRFRAGYHLLRLGRKNPAFGGNLFYFALGYQIFIQRPEK